MFRNVMQVHKGRQTRRVIPGVTSHLRHTVVIVTGQVYSTDGQKSVSHKNRSESHTPEQSSNRDIKCNILRVVTHPITALRCKRPV